MMEIWKPAIINGVSIPYQASTLGRIRHHTTHRIKSQHTIAYGRVGVNVYIPSARKKRTVKVSKIIAETFLGRPDDGEQIEHMDQDPQNNSIENLAYVSQSTNILRSLLLRPREPKNSNRYLSPQTYETIFGLWQSGKYSQVEIGRIMGLNNATISKIVNHKISPRHNGKLVIVPDFGVIGGER